MTLIPLPSTLSANGMDQGSIYAWMQNVTALINGLTQGFSSLQGDGLLGVPGLTLGSNKDDVANLAFSFIINGNEYNKAAITTGTGPGNDVVPEDLYGAVAFEIGVNGTVDAIEAAANATGYASAALAVAGIPAVQADHVRMGHVTVTKSDGAFTFGTTEFDAANVTAVFTDASSILDNLSSQAQLSDVLKLTKG